MRLEAPSAADQVPFSHLVLQKVSGAFRRDARREDLSEEKAGRFEAWVLAFVSWCAGQEPGTCDSGEGKASEVKACRIGEFQVALRGRPECTQREAVEAMDALAFFFGAAEETKAALRSAGFSVENGDGSSAGPSSNRNATRKSTTDEDASQKDTSHQDAAHQGTPGVPDDSRSSRVFPGWPGRETTGTTSSEDTAAGETRAAGTGESTGLGQGAVSRPASHEDASSTAKAFVRAFHSQLDSVHGRTASTDDERLQGKMQGARAH